MLIIAESWKIKSSNHNKIQDNTDILSEIQNADQYHWSILIFYS